MYVGDGEISDLEFEAYKIIRDKGKQPESSNEENSNSDYIDSDDSLTVDSALTIEIDSDDSLTVDSAIE